MFTISLYKISMELDPKKIINSTKIISFYQRHVLSYSGQILFYLGHMQLYWGQIQSYFYCCAVIIPGELHFLVSPWKSFIVVLFAQGFSLILFLLHNVLSSQSIVSSLGSSCLSTCQVWPCTLHCTVYCALFTLHHCTLYTTYSAYTSKCSIEIYTLHCTQFTLNTLQCTI